MPQKLARYWKAILAVVAGLVAAGALLPSDAPAWLLGLIPILNAVLVGFGPANAPRDTPSYPRRVPGSYP